MAFETFLTPRIVFERGRFVAKVRAGSRRFQRTLQATTEAGAREELTALGSVGLHEAIFVVDEESRANPRQLMELLNKTRCHAKQRGIDFAITKAELLDRFRLTRGRCEVSGLPFDQVFKAPGAMKRPFAVSIDRIDSRAPYTIGNVRLVCAIANMAMGEWGEEALYRLAAAIVMRRKFRED